jgi:hypothetical protein
MVALAPIHPPGSGADARSRELRRKGLRIVLAVRDTEVDALVGHGLLDPARREDRSAIARARGRLLDQIRQRGGTRLFSHEAACDAQLGRQVRPRDRTLCVTGTALLPALQARDVNFSIEAA